MVDSGSSMNLISNSLIQKLSLPIEQKQKIMLWSINGKKVATQGCWTMPGTLSALGVDLIKHSFYVALTGQFEALVGLPRLQKIALSIDWSQGLLLLRSSKRDPSITTASVACASPGIPPEYAHYADLFDKEAADVLLVHQVWNHCIPL